jgi:hypothetical protein
VNFPPAFSKEYMGILTRYMELRTRAQEHGWDYYSDSDTWRRGETQWRFRNDDEFEEALDKDTEYWQMAALKWGGF